MPREITHHGEILEAIGNSGILSELVEAHEGHLKHELDVELVVYGRDYAGRKVGPYARLYVYQPGEVIIRQGQWRGNSFYVLVTGRLDVCEEAEDGASHKCGEIESQNSFGEMSLLSGQPSNATVVVSPEGEARVLEIQRPALRLLRRFKKFGDRLQQNYHRHGLDRTLLEVQQATHNAFSSELLKDFKEATKFAVYGKGHILFREGDPIDRLVFINRGWARRVCELASDLTQGRRLASNPILADMVMELDQDIGLDFLGAGNWLGLEAISRNDEVRWKYTTTIMARTEVLEIEISQLRSNP